MRIIGRIPHPNMQITVFTNDGRFPVQFERGGLTQQYRFRQGPGLENFANVKRLIDEAFLRDVAATFRLMHKTRARAVSFLAGEEQAEEFPDIL